MRSLALLLVASSALTVLGPSAAVAQGALRPTLTTPASAAAPLAYYKGLGAWINRDTYIGSTSALGITNSRKFTMIFSIFGDNSINASNGTGLRNGYVFNNKKTTICEVNGGTSPGACGSIDNSVNSVQWNFNNSTGTSTTTDKIEISGLNVATPRFFPGVINTYVITMDIDGGGTGHCAIAHQGLNRINANGSTFACPTNFATITGSPDFNNSDGFQVGNMPGTSPAAIVPMESTIGLFYLGVGEYIGCNSAGNPTADCVSGETIQPAVLARIMNVATNQFYDPGSACTNWTGRQPEVCLTGDGTDLAINRGTGAGIAERTNNAASASAYANRTGLQPASYGQNGMVAGRPTLKWIAAVDNSGTTTPISTSSKGYTPATGDLLILFMAGADSSGSTNHNWQCPSGGTSTWTLIGRANNTTESMNAAACYAFAAAGETGTNNITFTTSFTRSTTWVLADYGQVTSVGLNNVQLQNSAVNHVDNFSGSTTCAHATLVSAFTAWSMNNALPQTPPTALGALSTYVRYKVPPRSTATPQIAVVDTYNVASGTTSAQQMSLGSASNGGGVGFTVELCP